MTRKSNRFFSNNAPLEVLHRPIARPNLPFLSHALSRGHAIRPVSTATMENMRYQFKLAVYWTAIGWTVIAGGVLVYFFFHEDWLDKLHPCPKEWPWIVKRAWRTARHRELYEGPESGHIDWVQVGSGYGNVLHGVEGRTKGPSGHGEADVGLIHQDDWDPTIPGIDPEVMRTPTPECHDKPHWHSRVGWDITAKSEVWRRAYYQAMMGYAAVAELRSDHLVRTTDKRSICYPPNTVRSEENPYPILVPGVENPDISEMALCFEPADVQYIRILTTKGFSRQERLDTGIAYARWLDSIGNASLAEQMFRWSLNLAADGSTSSPSTSTATSISSSTFIDLTTGILPSTTPFTTPNLLKTSRELASHLARHDKIPAALAIYLSVLRAQRASPEAPALDQYPWHRTDYNLKTPASWIKFALDLPFRGEFDMSPSKGDDPFERTQADKCDEAELMAYVGEILFAKGGKRRQGVSWTREATELAQMGAADTRLAPEARKVCNECLITGLENWKNMAGALAREKSEAAGRERERGWLGWVWSAGGPERWVTRGLWAEEEELVRTRLTDLEEGMLKERLDRAARFNVQNLAVG